MHLISPDATADPWSGGMIGFRRTNNPTDDSWPFRGSRFPDEHPDDMGMDPPGRRPGKWTQTNNEGKRWRWREDRTPDTPGSGTVRDQAGTEAVGHEGHWTSGEVRSFAPAEDRFWQWVQDTNDSAKNRGGTTSALADELNELRDQMHLPGIRPQPPARIPENTVQQNLADIDIVRRWEREGGDPEFAEKMLRQMHERRNLRRDAQVREDIERADPAFQTANPLLDVPDPRFHPARGQDPFAPSPPTGARMAKPAGLMEGGSNPFDPQGDRFRPSLEQLLEKAQSNPSSNGQPRLPGIGRPTNPYDKAEREFLLKNAQSLDFEAVVNPYDPVQQAVFLDANVDWDSLPAKLLDSGKKGINDSFKGRYGPNGKPFFKKTTTVFGEVNLEVKALEAGPIIGVDVLPVKKVSGRTIVTPWVNGGAIQSRDGTSMLAEAREFMMEMDPVKRDKKLLFEYLVLDSDKHYGNYYVDMDNRTLTGIDYGGAFQGDEYGFLDRHGGNAFVRLMRDALGKDVRLSPEAFREVAEQKDAFVDHFRDTLSDYQIADMEDRFDRIAEMGKQDNLTLTDFGRSITARRN